MSCEDYSDQNRCLTFAKLGHSERRYYKERSVPLYHSFTQIQDWKSRPVGHADVARSVHSRSLGQIVSQQIANFET